VYCGKKGKEIILVYHYVWKIIRPFILGLYLLDSILDIFFMYILKYIENVLGNSTLLFLKLFKLLSV
jgi:hypothetical protein